MLVFITMPRLKQVKRSEKIFILCGVCNKQISDKEVELNFTTTCVVCSEKCWVHAKCANRVVKNRIGGLLFNNDQKSNAKVFRQTSVELYCTLCEDDCYICKTRHTSKC